MRKHFKHSKLFYQYLFSYLCILLIPLFIISTFVSNYVFGILRDEIRTNNMHSLSRAMATLEAQITPLTSLSHSVYLDNILDQFSLSDDTIKGIQVQKELSKYKQTNPFMYDIAYYQEQDDYIMTSHSSCPKALFFNRMYAYENYSYSQFLADIKKNPHGFIIGAQNITPNMGSPCQFITYVRPITDKTTTRCVLYLIEASFFSDILPSSLNGHGASAILGPSGELIVCTGNDDLISLLTSENQFPTDTQDYITLSGQKYLVSSVISENTDWQYLTLVPQQDVRSRLNRVSFLMGLMCFIAAASGLAGVIFFMKRNYTPIQSLENISNQIMQNDNEGNEIDHVANVLSYLNNQNQQLLQNDAAKNLAVRERFIIKLISGQYLNRQKILEKAEMAGIALKRTHYQAAVCQVRALKPGQDSSIEDLFLDSRPYGSDILARVVPETCQILLGIGYDDIESEKIEKYLCDMVDMIKNDFHLTGYIALGQAVDDIENLAASYRQAIQTLEYHIILDDKKLITYEETLDRKLAKFTQDPRRLDGLIESKNIEGMDEFLEAWTLEMRTSNAPVKQLRKQCNELIYTVEHIIQKMNRDYFVDNPLYSNISSVLIYENITELTTIVHLIGCDIITQFNELTGNSLTESLVQYVRNNCFSCDFSTTSMAEEFQMSLPYLSQYFKSHVGKNLLDYVTELKIERAKELLLETLIPVREIAEQVGYYNVNSFSRRFKQITGVTPGEYRKQIPS